MSVQAGIWNLDGGPVDRQLLLKISRRLADYGPDGEATYFDGPVGMLYRPFCTTPESRVEHQPQASCTGKSMTWDGRLDNRDDLISELSADLTSDRTDVAIAMAAFERWGPRSFAKLIGDWALAVWNPTENELFLARDYAGVRHLFYYPNRRMLVWCSHLAPLVLSGSQFTLCEEYFAGYLVLWPDANLTPYREIHSVPPGNFVRVHNLNVSVRPFWDINPGLKIRYKTDKEYEEHFCHVFRQAVRRRLRTDSPILADLSGGLDSSSIVCMADDILAREGAEAPSLDTFSVSDRSEPDEEDFLYYTKVEERRGRIGHHAAILGLGDSLVFKYRKFAATPGFGEREEVKTIRSDLILKYRYRVTLSGMGGDEITGNTLDPCMQSADLLQQLRVRDLGRQLMDWSLLLRRPWMQLFLDSLTLLLPTAIRARITTGCDAEPWINETFARRYRMRVRQLSAVQGSFFWPPSFRDSVQTLVTLSRQLTRTPPSMYETRYPFLDQTLVEFLMHIPTDQLLRPGERRSLMRRSLVGFLPPAILSRRTKSGLGRCFILGLEKHWTTLERMLSSPFLARLGWIKKAQFQRAMEDAKNGCVSSHFFRLLNCLSAEIWLRDLVAQGMILPPP
ncbi:MAG: hypothetical protein JWO91_19 [Acidobacteriaceae bacterium]|nr:hypothetical protein [Acidobacteriaceae bacterium]